MSKDNKNNNNSVIYDMWLWLKEKDLFEILGGLFFICFVLWLIKGMFGF